MAESIQSMMISGTSTFIMLLNKKFCSHCVPVAHSAASRFLFIDAILLLKARSNLSASTISNVADQVLLLAATSVYPLLTPGLMLHVMVFCPKDWLNIDLILMLIPTFVHGFTTNALRIFDA